MRKTFVLFVASAMGLAPLSSFAEVTFSGASDTNVFGYPRLDGPEISNVFNNIFGMQGVLRVNILLTQSGAGRPLAVYSLEYSKGIEALGQSSRASGSLDERTLNFETAVRAMACGGAYNEFLAAGGSLRVDLVAPEIAVNDPKLLVFDSAVGQLMRLEIDIPKDCEAP